MYTIGEACCDAFSGADWMGRWVRAFDMGVAPGAPACNICLVQEYALFNSFEGWCRGGAVKQAAVPGPARPPSGEPTRDQQRRDLINAPEILRDRAARRTRRSAPERLDGARGCSAVLGFVDAGPGGYEVDAGITPRDGAAPWPAGSQGKLRAVLLGGAAGGFVRPGRLDVGMTSRMRARAGTRWGRRRDGVNGRSTWWTSCEDRRGFSATNGAVSACRAASGTVRQEEALLRW